MIAALLLAAASLPTAVDAERAFNRDAQRIGQWTAFRKYADRDAVMFTPQATWAREFLKGRKDPPKSVTWRPTHSWVSCDGRTAVNTGPAFRDGKAYGYFTTVWQRNGRQWHWVYDGGGPLAGPPAAAGPARVHRATCGTRAPGPPVIPPPPLSARQARVSPEDNGRGESADKTLGWDWKVERDGGRRFRVYLWTGARYAQVLYNDVPAPKPQ
jgi:hypothetical protein